MSDSVSSELIVSNLSEGILAVTICRTNKKNALTASMYAELSNAIQRAEKEPDIKVILLTGSDNVFTAGNDLNDFLSLPFDDLNNPIVHFLLTIAKTDIPIVAAVNGVAVGIGVTLLLHCDQVFAAKSSTFSMPFINLGLSPEGGSTLLLPQIVGYQKAAALLMQGDNFDAMEAKDAGIVAAVIEDEILLPQARAFAKKLASKPKSTLRKTKQLLRRDIEPLEQRIKTEAAEFNKALQSSTAKEIMTAFLEQRDPDSSKFD